MKKVKYAFLAVFSLLLCFCLGACRFPWIKYFYDYHVVWYSDDPFIEFIGDEWEGKMSLNGVEYNICLGANAGADGFYFYDHDKHDEDDDLIWQGTAKVKDGQLYLTVVTDNVSDYAGKTIVLNQRPVDETE